MSSNRPALAIRRSDLGHLGVGAPADITVLKLCESDFPFRDVTGIERRGRYLLQPEAVFLAGREMEISDRPFEAPYLTKCGCSGEAMSTFACN
jgi:dihydroorotase